MKRVIYHVTYKVVDLNTEQYGCAVLKIQEDQENGTASEKFEDFMKTLEETSGNSRHNIIIINTIKFE